MLQQNLRDPTIMRQIYRADRQNCLAYDKTIMTSFPPIIDFV